MWVDGEPVALELLVRAVQGARVKNLEEYVFVH
jgi:hypothetical protein